MPPGSGKGCLHLSAPQTGSDRAPALPGRTRERTPAGASAGATVGWKRACAGHADCLTAVDAVGCARDLGRPNRSPVSEAGRPVHDARDNDVERDRSSFWGHPCARPAAAVPQETTGETATSTRSRARGSSLARDDAGSRETLRTREGASTLRPGALVLADVGAFARPGS